MSWGDVDSEKATDKQIEYASILLEALNGEVFVDLRNMTKKEISGVIEKAKAECDRKNIDYHYNKKKK